ncbi:MAG: hypothetical protein ACXVAX_05120 [Pseudobdellovibrio sp.]
MNKRKAKKQNTKMKTKKKLMTKKHTSEKFFDRDKNLTYLPNDESISELVTEDGIIEVFHPSHNPS